MLNYQQGVLIMNLRKSVKMGFAIKGGNQGDLSSSISKSEPTLSKYMTGKIDPPLSVVLSIADYFDVPMSTFCKWSETNEK